MGTNDRGQRYLSRSGALQQGAVRQDQRPAMALLDGVDAGAVGGADHDRDRLPVLRDHRPALQQGPVSLCELFDGTVHVFGASNAMVDALRP